MRFVYVSVYVALLLLIPRFTRGKSTVKNGQESFHLHSEKCLTLLGVTFTGENSRDHPAGVLVRFSSTSIVTT